jgi:threonine synthase
MFSCTVCPVEVAAGPRVLRCPDCASPLLVDYGQSGPLVRSESGSPLPLKEPGSVISLGEGGTPLIALPDLSSQLGLGRLTAKLESSNPTGSFKDRGMSVMLGALGEHGEKAFVEDSSGNAGASAAAHAARAGMVAHVFVPESAPAGKIAQIAVYGATVHIVPGARERATEAAQDFVAESGLAYANHNLSPYFIEGTKSFAHELIGRVGDTVPDHIVVPVGNGSLFIATHLALIELQSAGRVTRLPKLHAVQARAAMPIVAAFRSESWSPEPGAVTIAGGIASADPPRKAQILAALQETNGTPVAVGDEEITHWRSALARREGVYAESTSAAAFAGLEKLIETGAIQKGDAVLVPITGSGLKEA